jgi:hypothetical protein
LSGTKAWASGRFDAVESGTPANDEFAGGAKLFVRATKSYDGVVVELDSWKADVPWRMFRHLDGGRDGLEGRPADVSPSAQGSSGQGLTLNQVDLSPVEFVGHGYAE